MTNILTILGTIASTALIVSYIQFLRRTGVITLFHVTTCSILVSNGIGLAFTQNTKIAEESGVTETSLGKAAVAILLFAAIMWGLSRLFYDSRSAPLARRNQSLSGRRFLMNPRALIATSFAMLLVALGAYRFLLVNGAIAYLGESFATSVGSASHYEVRAEISDEYLAAGRGAYAAGVALFLICPVLIPLLIMCWLKCKRWVFLGCALAMCGVQLTLALVLGHRAPVLFCLLQPLVTWALFRNAFSLGPLFRKWLAAVYIFIGVVFTTGGAMVFQLSDNTDFVDGVGRLYSRICIVPVTSSSFVFDLFPNTMPYRGILRCLDMADAAETGAGVNFGDIALASTGVRYDSNSYLVAVAYSGFGYVGVIAVSVLYFFYCYAIDRFVGRGGAEVRALAVSCSLYTLAAIGNVPFFTAVLNFGFGLTAVAAVWLYQLWFPVTELYPRSTIPRVLGSGTREGAGRVVARKVGA